MWPEGFSYIFRDRVLGSGQNMTVDTVCVGFFVRCFFLQSQCGSCFKYRFYGHFQNLWKTSGMIFSIFFSRWLPKVAPVGRSIRKSFWEIHRWFSRRISTLCSLVMVQNCSFVFCRSPLFFVVVFLFFLFFLVVSLVLSTVVSSQELLLWKLDNRFMAINVQVACRYLRNFTSGYNAKIYIYIYIILYIYIYISAWTHGGETWYDTIRISLYILHVSLYILFVDVGSKLWYICFTSQFGCHGGVCSLVRGGADSAWSHWIWR